MELKTTVNKKTGNKKTGNKRFFIDGLHVSYDKYRYWETWGWMHRTANCIYSEHSKTCVKHYISYS